MKRSNVKVTTPRKAAPGRKRQPKASGAPQAVVGLIESIPDEFKNDDEKAPKKGKAKKGNAPKAPKIVEAAPECCCGCGKAVSKVGKFWLPGHDARAHGQMKKAARGEAIVLPESIWKNYENFGFIKTDKEVRVWMEANRPE